MIERWLTVDRVIPHPSLYSFFRRISKKPTQMFTTSSRRYF